MPTRSKLAATATSRDGGTWSSPDAAVLVVLSGSSKGATRRLPGEIGGTLRVGKARDNDFVLEGETVSRHHVVFTRTAEGIVVEDAGSRNGVRIGPARVTRAYVEPGTVIELGDAALLVRVDFREAVVPPSRASSFGEAIGRTLEMRRIFGLLERIAPTDATVVFLGETGTGKDVLARSVHHASPRANGPFETVDCGAIAPTLIESELFGHERGAFTGAVAPHTGAFERASGGTLFLDELGEMPLALQPKLLRALESREIRRVGGKKPIPVDVRVLAATMRDLPAEAEAGRFRQDLWFRIAVVPVVVPPLRVRLDDLPLLAEQILRTHGGIGLAPGAIAQLRSHDWPGNVRELRNVLDRAAYLARAAGEREIGAVHVGAQAPAAHAGDPWSFEPGVSYRDARAAVEAAFEARFVAWILERAGGNVAAAAREAQMDRKYLAELAKRHGLKTRGA